MAPHAPVLCHSFKRRQQVIPDGTPERPGTSCQGVPVARTKAMPSSAARSERRGLPPLGLGGSGGKRGSTASHSSSLTRCWCTPSRLPAYGCPSGRSRKCGCSTKSPARPNREKNRK